MSMKNRSKHGVNNGRSPLPSLSTGSVLKPPQVQSLAQVSINPVPSVFNVDDAFKTIEKIRRDVVVHHNTYYVQGRNVMLEIMSRVYQQFQSAKDSNEFDKFMRLVRDGLTKSKTAYSKASTESSQLINYLFADLSYKQTHVYSRALDEAYRQKVIFTNFEQFVKDNGGFEGIRQSVVATNENTISAISKKFIEAFTEISNSSTVETINVNDWNENERFRIYVAVLNEDGEIDLKNSMLEEKHAKEVIIRSKSFLDKLKNPSVDKSASLKNESLLKMESLLATAKADKEHLDERLKVAIAEGNSKLCDEIRININTADLLIYGYREIIKNYRKNLKSTIN